jgi:hypothetical protein
MNKSYSCKENKGGGGEKERKTGKKMFGEKLVMCHILP